jgi:hypothetical protein
MRICEHDGCGRTMGRNGKSYTYGGVFPGEDSRNVCPRCHRKLQRPSLKKWREKFFSDEAAYAAHLKSEMQRLSAHGT